MNDNEIIFAKIKTLDDLEGEEWRNVRNHKHYFVSNYGRVKSDNKACFAFAVIINIRQSMLTLLGGFRIGQGR